jgi:capsular exopolysaccharide synthesis family protein
LNKFKKSNEHDTDSNDTARIINTNTPFAISEAFRTLYTNVLYLPIADKCRKIAVTSGFSGEGKTYTSINLALTIAKSDAEHKVLLIDCDMRKPRIAHLIPSVKSGSHGLSEYLAGIDSTPAIQQTDIRNLSVLTSGSESANATALISSSRFASMMKELEEKYTYIIFDTPPVNVVSDAILLNDRVNGYFIITRADYSDVNEVGDVFEKLKAVNANVFGICLTALSPKSYTRGYYKRVGKYKKYGRYAKYAYSDVYGR